MAAKDIFHEAVKEALKKEGVAELRYDEENICSLIKGIKPII
jgi:hypothetical protein